MRNRPPTVILTALGTTMNDKRLPYFPFYPGDWLSSPTVAGLSLEQQGAYLRLLCYQWQDGPLPTDISALSNLCGIDREAMAELWQGLGRAFTETEEGLVNERLRKEKNKILNRRERLSEAGKRGANARWDKDENGEAMAGPEGGHGEAMATTESDTKAETKQSTSAREDDETSGRSRAVKLPDGWEPNENHADIATEEGVNLDREVEQFRDHAKANGRTQRDWDASFRNWLRKAADFGSGTGRVEEKKETSSLSDEEYDRLYGVSG